MASLTFGIEELGFRNLGKVFRNLTVESLVEDALDNNEGKLANNGALAVDSGENTEKIPQDKYYVIHPDIEDQMWWGQNTGKMSSEVFEKLKTRVVGKLNGQTLYLNDFYCGSDSNYNMKMRFISPRAWHSFFVRNLFRNAPEEVLENFTAEFTIIAADEYYEKEFSTLGLKSKSFVAIDLSKKIAIIAGTAHSEEIKKCIFSIANFFFPEKGVLSTHCAANLGNNNDIALFYGRTGTGKTTLSADPNKTTWHRRLIGDDAIGWSAEGIFNLEDGCYARCYNINPNQEPDIFSTIRYGSIIENVTFNDERKVNFTDDSKTKNLRIAYPLDYIHNSIAEPENSHPKNIFILACDMYGVLPAIAKLTPEQALYYFLSGYSCKVEEGETGLNKIIPVFSECFASEYMPLRPNVYAELFDQKINKYKPDLYLVNTGWISGTIDDGSRIDLLDTRKVIESVLDGAIKNSNFEIDTVFGYEIPKNLAGVDASILNPRTACSDAEAYDDLRVKLAKMFIENFDNFAQYGPKTGDLTSAQYLYKQYNVLKQAGPQV